MKAVVVAATMTAVAQLAYATAASAQTAQSEAAPESSAEKAASQDSKGAQSAESAQGAEVAQRTEPAPGSESASRSEPASGSESANSTDNAQGSDNTAAAASPADDELFAAIASEDTGPSAETAPAPAPSAAAATAPTPPVASAEGSSPSPAAAQPAVDVIPVAEKPAQPQAAAEPERRPPSVIEEVVVTAQRREESAQDVPISITVFDQKQLANANITNSADLAVYTPSLSTNQRFGSDNATFSIRGFTQELRTTASVATYMAEVVAPRGQSSQTSGDGAGPGALFDLQNVQVLKGPQGTLFGRNTTGGAVLLVPNRPTDEFEGYVELSGGNFGMFRKQAVVNVPVSDRFRTRLALDFNERDGHLDNITGIGADELGNTDYLSARFSTVWDLSDTLENYTILSYIDSDSRGYSTRLFACNPNPDPNTNPFFALTNQPCQQQLANQAATGQDGFYDLVSTIRTPLTAIEEKRLINTTTWDFSDNASLKGILAYAHLHTENGSDIFGTQFRAAYDPDPRREFKMGVSVINPDIPVTSQQTWVGELQLQGSSVDDALQWQGGVYYENSRPDGFSGNNSAGLISCEVATLEGDPSQFNCFDPTANNLGSVQTQEFKTKYLNRAVYLQGTYHFSEVWSSTLGLRHTWDRSEGYGIKTRYGFAGPVPLPPTRQVTRPETSSQAPTGLFEVSYKPHEEVMIYGKYLRGYRQGNVILAADPGVDTFEPEKVDTYELGAKTGFAGPIPGRFNVAVFYNDFTDQQLQFGYISPSAGPTTTITNAGKSRIQGLEAEAYFQLLESLTLALSYSYLDTELLEQNDYTDEVAAAGGPVAGATATPIADVGDELPYAPEQSYVASLNWRLPVSEQLGELAAGVTYSRIGEQRSAASSATPYGMLDAFELVNLNLGWTRMFQTPLDLSVFATNVLDEEYTTYVSGTYNVLGFETRMVGLPRMIGARLKYNFGAAAQ